MSFFRIILFCVLSVTVCGADLEMLSAVQYPFVKDLPIGKEGNEKIVRRLMPK